MTPQLVALVDIAPVNMHFLIIQQARDLNSLINRLVALHNRISRSFIEANCCGFSFQELSTLEIPGYQSPFAKLLSLLRK